MTGYEEFQRIMAELNYKVKNQDKSYDLPPGFEEIFSQFKR